MCLRPNGHKFTHYQGVMNDFKRLYCSFKRDSLKHGMECSGMEWTGRDSPISLIWEGTLTGEYIPPPPTQALREQF